MADSCTIKEAANVTRTMDQEEDVDNIGTTGHHLVCSGDFKVKDGATIPNIGDVITDDEVASRSWVVTSDVEVTGFSSGGRPVIIQMDLEYHAKVSDG